MVQLAYVRESQIELIVGSAILGRLSVEWLHHRQQTDAEIEAQHVGKHAGHEDHDTDHQPGRYSPDCKRHGW